MLKVFLEIFSTGGILIEMLFLGLHFCILCTIYPVSGVWDQRCGVNTCTCCKNEKCYQGPLYPNTCLTGCIDGHRGSRCYELCQYENCKSCGGSQNPSTVCEECYDGYYLGANKDCTSKCSANCKSCNSSTSCTVCKEGFYNKNGATTCPYSYCPTNCECNIGQGDCVSCKNGFYDTSTLCSKQCPFNCLSCESEESCKECKSGFYNGYEYDNNVHLQLNNCSYACRDTCTQCQSYNNCLQCVEGKYGQTCQDDCSVRCKDRTCLFDSGHCECAVGFTGDKCMECVVGKYGLFCNKTCSKFCKEDKCDRNTGECIYGCVNGYSGDRCCVKSGHCIECTNNEECRKCSSGFYTNLCNERCPEACPSSCDILTGVCSNCQYNRFGNFCEFNCLDSCKFEEGIHERVCTRSDATCKNGCNDGFFGRTCNITCSRLCIGDTCRQDDGVCIKGCEGHHEESECFISEEQKDGDGKMKTIAMAILGSFFTVLVIIIIVKGAIKLVRKRRTNAERTESRQQFDVAYENHLMSTALQCSTNNDTEHEYQTISTIMSTPNVYDKY